MTVLASDLNQDTFTNSKKPDQGNSLGRKTYVLDTSVLIHDPSALREFDDNHLVLPIAVLEELDGLKKARGDLGYSARETLRSLDKLIKDVGSDDVRSGIKMEGGGTLRFDTNTNSYELLPSNMERSRDNSIILAAMRIKNSNLEARVIVVSKDINMRLKAIALGVEAEDYEADKVKNIDALYSGVEDLCLPDSFLAELYKHGKLEDFKDIHGMYGNKVIFPNSCFRLSSSGKGKVALARYIAGTDSVVWIDNPTFFNRLTNEDGPIKPINDEQIFAYYMAMDPNIKILSLYGPPGTGKTLMALRAGRDQLGSRYERILVFRGTKDIGEPLGYLPGTEDEKIAPWARPIATSLKLITGGGKHSKGSDEHNKNGSFDPGNELMRYGLVEVLTINYIRGDTFHDCFVIVDDAQNFTPHQIKAVLTRIGSGSKCILTGDLDQIDEPLLDAHSSGLTKVLNVFPGKNDMYAQLNLVKGERSAIANMASRLL